jgi:hypothetical protein
MREDAVIRLADCPYFSLNQLDMALRRMAGCLGYFWGNLADGDSTVAGGNAARDVGTD